MGSHLNAQFHKVRELVVTVDASDLRDDNGYNMATVEEFDTVRLVILLPNNHKRVITVPAEEYVNNGYGLQKSKAVDGHKESRPAW